VIPTFDDQELAVLAANIGTWLEELGSEYDHITAVEFAQGADGVPRWFVRMSGEDKDVSTVWFWLGQRTLHFENYVLPAPEENAAQVYEHVLRCNHRLVGLHFAIGDEDAIYLRGELANDAVTSDELDRVLGSVYATVEQCFMALIRLAFASRFRNDE